MRLIDRQLPIVVISGRPIGLDAIQDAMVAARLAALSPLQKPFKPSALPVTVTRSLEARSRPWPSPIVTGNVISRP